MEYTPKGASQPARHYGTFATTAALMSFLKKHKEVWFAPSCRLLVAHLPQALAFSSFSKGPVVVEWVSWTGLLGFTVNDCRPGKGCW